MTTKQQMLSHRSRRPTSYVRPAPSQASQQVRAVPTQRRVGTPGTRVVAPGSTNRMQVRTVDNSGPSSLIVKTISGGAKPQPPIPDAQKLYQLPPNVQMNVRQGKQEPAPPQVQPSAAPRANVTVLLSSFERPQFLRTQVDTILAQTVQPAQMMIWQNPGAVPPDDHTLNGLASVIIRSNANLGPWFRFTLALEAPTEYVCILDDDTIPGPQWLEQAMKRLEDAAAEGKLLCIASAGKIFRSDDATDFVTIGPEYPQPEEKEVDIGQNGWIFHKSLLWMFAANPVLGDRRIGWDLHLAASLQREDIPTVVLPYPPGDRGSWGMVRQADNETSLSRKLDAMAESGGQTAEFLRKQLYSMYRDSGWEPQVVREQKSDSSESSE